MKQGAEIPMDQWIRRARNVARLVPESEKDWLGTAEGKAWYDEVTASLATIGKSAQTGLAELADSMEDATETFTRCEDSQVRAWFMNFVK